MKRTALLIGVALLTLGAMNATAYEYAGFDKFLKDVGAYLTNESSKIAEAGEQALAPITGVNWENYVRLVNNTDQCLVDCYAVVEVSNPTSEPMRLADNGWRTWVEKANGTGGPGEDLKLAVWKANLKDVDEPVYGDVETKYECKTDNLRMSASNGTCVDDAGSAVWSAEVIGSTESDGITTVTGKGHGVKEYVKKQVEVEEYEPTSTSDIVIAPGEKKLVRIEGKKVAALGENNVDWKLEYMGVRPPWAWWNSTWSYRQNYTISNGGASGLTNFQVIMDVNTSTLISGGKMRSDCADIRFTNAAGTGTVYHTLQKGTCNKVHTYLTVNVSSIPASGSSNITMYYGNPNAQSADNPSMVFDFYDGFEGYSNNTDINGQNGWSVPSGNGVIYVRDNVALGESGKALAVVTTAGDSAIKTNAATQRTTGIYTLYVKTPGMTSVGIGARDGGGSYLVYAVGMDYDYQYYKYWMGGGSWEYSGTKYFNNTWTRIDMAVNDTLPNLQYYRWIKVNHTTIVSDKARDNYGSPYYIAVGGGLNAVVPVYADEVSISKFAETMPTYTAGIEEYLTSPVIQSFNATPSTVTTGNPVNVSANITQGLFTLDRWWYTYNGTRGGISAAQPGVNLMAWDTQGLLGDYTLQGFVNDTVNNVTSSAPVSVNVVSASTTTTTTTLPENPGGAYDGLLTSKIGGIELLPMQNRLYLDIYNLTINRPDGQYACCGPNNANQWACAQGVC